jgi:hypothetical protein
VITGWNAVPVASANAIERQRVESDVQNDLDDLGVAKSGRANRLQIIACDMTGRCETPCCRRNRNSRDRDSPPTSSPPAVP